MGRLSLQDGDIFVATLLDPDGRFASPVRALCRIDGEYTTLYPSKRSWSIIGKAPRCETMRTEKALVELRVGWRVDPATEEEWIMARLAGEWEG